MQSLSNLVQSGSIQIVNDMNGQYQDFCKYDMQVSIIELYLKKINIILNFINLYL